MRTKVIAALLLGCLAGCAGYQIGNRSLYPTHIRTVYVPMFESASFRRGLGERLTEAVMKEIELKTPYKVTGDPGADSVLSGRIVRETKRLLVPTRSDEPRELQTDLQVEIRWVDRRGSAIRSVQAIPLPPQLARVGATGDVIPQTGQSIATGHQTAIQRLAQQIVSMMEVPW